MTASMKLVEYVLFDMDGLLIDSEKIYTEVANDILSRYGKTMDWTMKAGLMGKPERAACELLLSNFPDIPLTLDEYIAEGRAKQAEKWSTVSLLPGAEKLLNHLSSHSIPFALATGSQKQKFLLKTAHLRDTFSLFKGREVCGDDHRIKGKGKPDPAVFLIAAGVLGRDVGEGDVELLQGDGIDKQILERSRGLVFEDAVNGVRAAKRAGMNVVWIPDDQLRKAVCEEELGYDQVLSSLEQFKPEEWGLPPYDS